MTSPWQILIVILLYDFVIKSKTCSSEDAKLKSLLELSLIRENATQDFNLKVNARLIICILFEMQNSYIICDICSLNGSWCNVFVFCSSIIFCFQT